MSLLGSCESLDDFGEAVAAVPLLREDEDRIEMMASSTLGIWFVQRWACGKMSALECLDGASRAADNEDDHLLTKLKKLGHSNPHRDLARLAYTDPSIAPYLGVVNNGTTGVVCQCSTHTGHGEHCTQR